MIRIGQGYDMHRLAANLPLCLGGVLIPAPFGVVATSDGDVLLHAIIDALLGAAALGDLGCFYDSARPEMQGVNSRVLLRDAMQRLREHNWRIVNIDSTLLLQAPKIKTFIAQMRDHIAEDCGITAAQVGVKATTSDGLGVVGEGRGIAAHAVVLLAGGKDNDENSN